MHAEKHLSWTKIKTNKARGYIWENCQNAFIQKKKKKYIKGFVYMDMRFTYLDGLDVYMFMKIWATPVY